MNFRNSTKNLEGKHILHQRDCRFVQIEEKFVYLLHMIIYSVIVLLEIVVLSTVLILHNFDDHEYLSPTNTYLSIIR